MGEMLAASMGPGTQCWGWSLMDVMQQCKMEKKRMGNHLHCLWRLIGLQHLCFCRFSPFWLPSLWLVKVETSIESMGSAGR